MLQLNDDHYQVMFTALVTGSVIPMYMDLTPAMYNSVCSCVCVVLAMIVSWSL